MDITKYSNSFPDAMDGVIESILRTKLKNSAFLGISPKKRAKIREELEQLKIKRRLKC